MSKLNRLSIFIASLLLILCITLPKAYSDVNLNSLPKATPETIYKYRISPLRIYQYAKQNQVRTIWYLRDYLDMEDNQDMTALCYAQIAKDQRAYNLLKKAGASTNVACHDNYYRTSTQSEVKEYVDYSGVLLKGTLIGGAIAGVAALAGGGGGGGSKATCEEGYSVKYQSVANCGTTGANGWIYMSSGQIGSQVCGKCEAKQYNIEFESAIDDVSGCEDRSSSYLKAYRIETLYSGDTPRYECIYIADTNIGGYDNEEDCMDANENAYKCKPVENIDEEVYIKDENSPNECPEGYSTDKQSKEACDSNNTGGYNYDVATQKSGELLCTKCEEKPGAPTVEEDIIKVEYDANNDDINNACFNNRKKHQHDGQEFDLLTTDTTNIENLGIYGEYKYIKCAYKCNETVGFANPDTTDTGWAWDSDSASGCKFKVSKLDCNRFNNNQDISTITLQNGTTAYANNSDFTTPLQSLSVSTKATDEPNYHGDDKCIEYKFSCDTTNGYYDSEDKCQKNEAGEIGYTCVDTENTGCYKRQENTETSCSSENSSTSYTDAEKCAEKLGGNAAGWTATPINEYIGENQCYQCIAVTCEDQSTQTTQYISKNDKDLCNTKANLTKEATLSIDVYTGTSQCYECTYTCAENWYESQSNCQKNKEGEVGYTCTQDNASGCWGNKTANSCPTIENGYEGETKQEYKTSCNLNTNTKLTLEESDKTSYYNGENECFLCKYKCDEEYWFYEKTACENNGGYKCSESRNEYGCYEREGENGCPDGSSTDIVSADDCRKRHGGTTDSWKTESKGNKGEKACNICVEVDTCEEGTSSDYSDVENCNAPAYKTAEPTPIEGKYNGAKQCYTCNYVCDIKQNAYADASSCNPNDGYNGCTEETDGCYIRGDAKTCSSYNTSETETVTAQNTTIYALNCSTVTNMTYTSTTSTNYAGDNACKECVYSCDTKNGWYTDETECKEGGYTCTQDETTLCWGNRQAVGCSGDASTGYTSTSNCPTKEYLSASSVEETGEISGGLSCYKCNYICDGDQSAYADASSCNPNDGYNGCTEETNGCYIRGDAKACSSYNTSETVTTQNTTIYALNCSTVTNMTYTSTTSTNYTGDIACKECTYTCAENWYESNDNCQINKYNQVGYTCNQDTASGCWGNKTANSCPTIENGYEGETKQEYKTSCNLDINTKLTLKEFDKTGNYNGENECFLCKYKCDEKNWFYEKTACENNGGYECSESRNEYGCYVRGQENGCPDGSSTDIKSKNDCPDRHGGTTDSWKIESKGNNGENACNICVAVDTCEADTSSDYIDVEKCNAPGVAPAYKTAISSTPIEGKYNGAKQCYTCNYVCDDDQNAYDDASSCNPNGGYEGCDEASKQNGCYIRGNDIACPEGSSTNYESKANCPIDNAHKVSQSAPNGYYSGSNQCYTCNYECNGTDWFEDGIDINIFTYTYTDTLGTTCYQATGCSSDNGYVSNTNQHFNYEPENGVSYPTDTTNPNKITCYKATSCATGTTNSNNTSNNSHIKFSEGFTSQNNIQCYENLGCNADNGWIEGDNCPDGFSCDKNATTFIEFESKETITCQHPTTCATGYASSNNLGYITYSEAYPSGLNSVSSCYAQLSCNETNDYYNSNTNVDGLHYGEETTSFTTPDTNEISCHKVEGCAEGWARVGVGDSCPTGYTCNAQPVTYKDKFTCQSIEGCHNNDNYFEEKEEWFTYTDDNGTTYVNDNDISKFTCYQVNGCNTTNGWLKTNEFPVYYKQGEAKNSNSGNNNNISCTKVDTTGCNETKGYYNEKTEGVAYEENTYSVDGINLTCYKANGCDTANNWIAENSCPDGFSCDTSKTANTAEGNSITCWHVEGCASGWLKEDGFPEYYSFSNQSISPNQSFTCNEVDTSECNTTKGYYKSLQTGIANDGTTYQTNGILDCYKPNGCDNTKNYIKSEQISNKNLKCDSTVDLNDSFVNLSCCIPICDEVTYFASNEDLTKCSQTNPDGYEMKDVSIFIDDTYTYCYECKPITESGDVCLPATDITEEAILTACNNKNNTYSGVTKATGYTSSANAGENKCYTCQYSCDTDNSWYASEPDSNVFDYETEENTNAGKCYKITGCKHSIDGNNTNDYYLSAEKTEETFTYDAGTTFNDTTCYKQTGCQTGYCNDSVDINDDSAFTHSESITQDDRSCFQRTGCNGDYISSADNRIEAFDIFATIKDLYCGTSPQLVCELVFGCNNEDGWSTKDYYTSNLDNAFTINEDTQKTFNSFTCYEPKSCNITNYYAAPGYISTYNAFAVANETGITQGNITCQKITGCNNDNGWYTSDQYNSGYAEAFNMYPTSQKSFNDYTCYTAQGCNNNNYWYLSEDKISGIIYSERVYTNNNQTRYCYKPESCDTENGWVEGVCPDGFTCNENESGVKQGAITCSKPSGCDVDNDWVEGGCPTGFTCNGESDEINGIKCYLIYGCDGDNNYTEGDSCPMGYTCDTSKTVGIDSLRCQKITGCNNNSNFYPKTEGFVINNDGYTVDIPEENWCYSYSNYECDNENGWYKSTEITGFAHNKTSTLSTHTCYQLTGCDNENNYASSCFSGTSYYSTSSASIGKKTISGGSELECFSCEYTCNGDMGWGSGSAPIASGFIRALPSHNSSLLYCINTCRDFAENYGNINNRLMYYDTKADCEATSGYTCTLQNVTFSGYSGQCYLKTDTSSTSLSDLDGEYITYLNEEGDFEGLDRPLASSDGSKEEASNRTFDLYNSAQSASITGLKGKEDGSSIYNAYAIGGENALYNANANATLNIIQQEGSGDNVITGIKSDNNVFNAFASGNASSYATINIEDQFSSDNIIYGLYSNKDAYNAYASGNNAFANANINIKTNTNKEAYGIYAQGNVYNTSNQNQKSTITINHKGSGSVYGLYSQKGSIYNSGDINITSSEGKAYGIYLRDGEGNTIENTGNININTTNEGYGIYVKDAGSQNAVQIYNKGIIDITANDEGRGIKIENNGANAFVENTGTIKVNGDINGSKAIDLGGATLLNKGVMRATTSSLNLDSFNATHILDGGTYIAESISGSTLVSINSALDNNKDELIEKDSFVAQDVSNVDIAHQSTMFDTKLVKNENNNYDAVSTRKNFNEFTQNKSIAEYLEQNYQKGNLTDLYNTFKSTEQSSELQQKINKATGSDFLGLLPQENIQTLRHVQEMLTDSILKPTNEIRRIVGGGDSYHLEREESSLITGYDNNTTTTYMYGDMDINTKNRLGLGLAILRSSTSYDNGVSRKENFINLFVPWIHRFKDNLNLASIFNLGYGFGHFDRGANRADIKDYAYGLTNRLTYKINLNNYAELEPQLFFNAVGYYQDQMKEEGSNALRIKQGNHTSVEAGFGLYLRKKLLETEKHKVSMKIGGAYYHEFADPFNHMSTGFVGGDGTFRIDDADLYDHDRAVLEATIDYEYKAIDMYLKYYHLIQKNKSQIFDFGVKYNF